MAKGIIESNSNKYIGDKETKGLIIDFSLEDSRVLHKRKMRFINKRKDKNSELNEIKSEMKERMFLANKRSNLETNNVNSNNEKGKNFKNKSGQNKSDMKQERNKSVNKFQGKKANNILSLKE